MTDKNQKNLEQVTAAAEEVLGVLGEGYDERPYEEALAHELRLRQVPYERQRNFEILYKGYKVGVGIADLVINPLWAGKGGRELVLELKAVQKIAESHKRQAQVYMLSLNIDEGAVLSFASEVLVAEVERPKKARKPAVAKPGRASRRSTADLLAASAKEVFRYFGQEFIYREDTKKLFPTALGVELRLRGCRPSEVTHPVLYKGHRVADCGFDFSFADGGVAETVFYKKPEQVDEALEALRFYKQAFGLKSAHLIAFPEKDEDEVRVVGVKGVRSSAGMPT